MTTKLDERAIEKWAIELLVQEGYCEGSNNDALKRDRLNEVLLTEKLRAVIRRLNPQVPISAIEGVLHQVQSVCATGLLSGNQGFHRMLTGGIQITYYKDGNEQNDIIWLIDFENPENNEFYVVNQFTVTENQHTKRPDIVLFVNGLPLVVIELKTPVNENVNIESAFNQLENYKATIPSLFTYNCVLVISDGMEALAGSLTADYKRFMAWKSADGITKNPKHTLKTLIKGMLNKKTLLDIIRYFIIFDGATKQGTKKLAAYHQYYAANKAVESVLQASKSDGNQGGVVWHTQGAGKSLVMVFAAAKIIRMLNNPTIVVITDRNDLDGQLFDTFATCNKELLRQTPVQAKNRQHLIELLKVVSGGIVFTTIQKFQPENGNVYPQLSDRRNIVVIADEAHRTQYGFKAKIIDETDDKGNVIGKKTVYGFAKYMRDALPNATYLGFTGTPIEKADINTRAVFGEYVDIYDIAQAVEDGATVKIFYESRLAKIGLSDEGKELINEVDNELAKEDTLESQRIKSKWTRLETILSSEKRIKNIAHDIVNHFEKKQEAIKEQASFEGKGMIVAMSRRIAVMLYNAIIELRPHWDNTDIDKGVIKVVMVSSSSDDSAMIKHHTTKEQRRILADRIKNPDDELKMVIVIDMWLTGFDVPSLHTLYIDKRMSGHSLMQAIARVNRVYKDKPAGLIVDYLGVASDLKKALAFYADSGGKGDPAIEQERAVNEMLEKIEIISQMFHGFPYKDYFQADTFKKLSIILDATEHILKLKDGKKRFTDQVTALSKAFATAIPHKLAIDAREEVAFFQAIKARLVKFTGITTEKTYQEIDTAVKQAIDKALVSEDIVDIFDAAGIKKPDISILSDDFLHEMKNMKRENIAMEVLKKILNDEIRARTKKNLVQSKSLMEILHNLIKKYHNKLITAAEIIEELIKLAKTIREEDSKFKKMGLSETEYAFYTAVAENESAREFMRNEQLKKLAITLTQEIKRNVSIDWPIKETARAKLRVIVKEMLEKFGYPPDMQESARDTVIKQAELIANKLTTQ